MRVLAAEAATEEAFVGLKADVSAKSTIGPRMPPFALLPLTVAKPEKIGAALKSAGFRTADQYLHIAKKEHSMEGHVEGRG